MNYTKKFKIPNDGDAARNPSRLVPNEGEKRSTECRFATLNVGGGMKEKLNEVCQMMDDKKIDILCVNETKRKGCEITSHGPYTAYWSGVPMTSRACQGVGLLLSPRMAQCVKEYDCVNARLVWIRMKVGLTRIFVVGVYAPVNMGLHNNKCEQDAREKFWEELRDVLRLCNLNERLILLGDFNGWVGVSREGFEKVLGRFGDESVNENGRSLLEVCLEWNLCVTNTMFEHKKIHMYTREAKNVRKSIIDFVIVDERLRKKVLDTRVYRGIGIHTDHFLVMTRISGLMKTWRNRIHNPKSVLERIKVENLQDEYIRDKYKSKLKEKFFHAADICSMEELWKTFKKQVVNVATEICGVTRRMKVNKVKNIWWDKDVQSVVREKKKAWVDWLAVRANERMKKATNEDIDIAKEEYKRKKRDVKEIVRRKKEDQEDEYDRRLSKDFQTNSKIFWKSIRSARGKAQNTELVSISDKYGRTVYGEECILERWKEYFESLFEREEPQKLSFANERDLEEGECISMIEITNALKGMRAGKSAGYDRITVEMLTAGEDITTNILYQLFNLCWTNGRVPIDWCQAVIVPLYKGKGSRQDCRNYRGISLLSIVGKLYAKVLIERVVKVTEKKIWDAQAGFRKSMGCTDQVFSLRCMAQKFLAKGQKVFCAFIDLEKAYDKVRRNELWSVLSMYGVNGHLIQALKSIYKDSRACVRINGSYTEWFNIDKGVRQGCVASPWLFNLFMDSCLQDLKNNECGLRMNELLVKCLLYADDQVLLASSAEDLQAMVTTMHDAFERKGMKVNVSKTKVMVFEKDKCMTECNIFINGEGLEQVKEFVYLGVLFTSDGKNDEDVERRVNAGNKVNGALYAFMKSRNVSNKARLAVHKGVLVPTLMYGSESWIWQGRHESSINAVEMRALRSMCGVSLKDKIRNSVIRERCGMNEEVVTKIKKGMLRWFGHVERMSEERLTKQVYKASVSGTITRGRPRRTFLDQIEDVLVKGQIKSTRNRRACMKTVMSVNEAMEVCQDRGLWQSVVSAYPSGKQA